VHPLCCGSKQGEALVSRPVAPTRSRAPVGLASRAAQGRNGHAARASSTMAVAEQSLPARPPKHQVFSPGVVMLIRAVRAAIWCYQIGLRPILGPRCRFEPSCSNYAMEAFQEHGLWAGGRLTCQRLCRCHPWGGSGWDPVPTPPTSPSSNQ
jgi:putative membrane protein insertion efficiency factor